MADAICLLTYLLGFPTKPTTLGEPMSQRMVFASDFSQKDIPDGEKVEVRVLELDGLSQPVRLDASKTEVDRLRVESSALALLELVLPDGETVRIAIPADQFRKAIRGDADAVLANAEGLSFAPPQQEEPERRRGRPRGSGGTGQKTKADREQLQAMRDWLRAEGHEVSDRGRIAANLQELYHAAHPQS